MPRVAAPTTQASAPAPVTGAPAPAPGIVLPPGAPPPRIPGGDPDSFVATGLANNFNGRVVSVMFLPRMYKTGRKANTYSLTREIVIQADDTSLGTNGIVTEYLKVDDLNQWVPSRTDPVWNGQQWIYTPAGGTLEQYLALHLGQLAFPDPEGKPAMLPPDDWRGYTVCPGLQNNRDGFKRGTKNAQFLKELKKTGYKDKAPHINWVDSRQFLVGVYGTWNRVAFEFEGGTPPPKEEGQRDLDTLCLTHLLDLGPISGANGPVAQVAVPASPTAQAPALAPTVQAPGPAPATAAPNRNDQAAIEAATEEVIVTLVNIAGNVGILKADIGTPVYEQLNARGLAGERGLLLCHDNNWLGGDARKFYYVEAKGRLAATAEIAQAIAAQP